MRFGVKVEDANKWHDWFAWRPVRLINRQWVWLETIERVSYWSCMVGAGAPNTLFGAWSFREKVQK